MDVWTPVALAAGWAWLTLFAGLLGILAGLLLVVLLPCPSRLSAD